jgi:hypothetical protein
MRDADIRQILKENQLNRYIVDENSKVVRELVIPAAKARIDMAVINGHLHGFEIKSASDTLIRLPTQIDAYSKIFDFLSVITEKKHSSKIYTAVPDWIGLYECSTSNGEKKIEEIRPPSQNDNKVGFHIAKLLWNEELLTVLRALNIKFRRGARNWILAETLAESLDVDTLSRLVREQLKRRKDWKMEF